MRTFRFVSDWTRMDKERRSLFRKYPFAVDLELNRGLTFFVRILHVALFRFEVRKTDKDFFFVFLMLGLGLSWYRLISDGKGENSG
jgi:hypothetical protein